MSAVETLALVVKTFALENYGDAEKPHWKRKCGSTTWVANVRGKPDFLRACNLAGVIQDAAPNLETRNSTGFIEMVDSVEVLALAEAERRAAIDTRDPGIDSLEFFAAIEKLNPFPGLYRVGDQA